MVEKMIRNARCFVAAIKQVVRRDRTWDEGKANKLLLSIFEILERDGQSAVAKKGRSRMTNLLFL